MQAESCSLFTDVQVFNLLLQILDDGRCTDSQGRTVDFKNTAPSLQQTKKGYTGTHGTLRVLFVCMCTESGMKGSTTRPPSHRGHRDVQHTGSRFLACKSFANAAFSLDPQRRKCLRSPSGRPSPCRGMTRRRHMSLTPCQNGMRMHALQPDRDRQTDTETGRQTEPHERTERMREREREKTKNTSDYGEDAVVDELARLCSRTWHWQTSSVVTLLCTCFMGPEVRACEVPGPGLTIITFRLFPAAIRE